MRVFKVFFFFLANPTHNRLFQGKILWVARSFEPKTSWILWDLGNYYVNPLGFIRLLIFANEWCNKNRIRLTSYKSGGTKPTYLTMHWSGLGQPNPSKPNSWSGFVSFCKKGWIERSQRFVIPSYYSDFLLRNNPPSPIYELHNGI